MLCSSLLIQRGKIGEKYLADVGVWSRDEFELSRGHVFVTLSQDWYFNSKIDFLSTNIVT